MEGGAIADNSSTADTVLTIAKVSPPKVRQLILIIAQVAEQVSVGGVAKMALYGVTS